MTKKRSPLRVLWKRNCPGAAVSFAGIILAITGCEQSASPSANGPAITSAVVRVNPLNALSAIVTVRSDGGESLSVQAISTTAPEVFTPGYSVLPESTVVPLLHLKPSTEYRVRVHLAGSAGSSVSDDISLVTPALPAELPDFVLLSASGPAPGYVMVGITSSAQSPKCFALVLDNDAEVVWYRGFDVPVTDFQKLLNGNFSVYASPDDGPSRFLELDLLGNIVREYSALHPSVTGPHELRLDGDEHFLFGVEFLTMDLSPIGGQQQASVRTISVQGFSSGIQTLHWSTAEHFSVEDAAEDISLAGSSVNPWHGNAIEIDGNDHLLVSFRNMDEITRIHRTTGEIDWRMGGKKNQFTFLADPLNGFSHQHGIRRLANGNIILFDNGNLHSPPVSRAVEYAVDAVARTATLVWEFVGSPELYSQALGFAQRLPNDHTLVCFGISRHIVEVDMGGQRRWEVLLDKPDYYPYRAFRIPSLY